VHHLHTTDADLVMYSERTDSHEHVVADPAETDVAEWERHFGEAIAASSHTASSAACVDDPWIAGYVHHLAASSAPPAPVRSGEIPVHQVLCFDQATTFVEERVHRGPIGHRGPVDPGGLFILGPDHNREDLRSYWEGPMQLTSVMLDPATLVRAAEALGRDYDGLAFITRYGACDPVIEALVGQLGRELKAGGGSGRLYAEELLQALAVHLIAHHTREEPTGRAVTGGLPGYRLNRVKDYVLHHLDQDLSLDDMADEVEMNPYHFLRLFKQSTGTTPYQWVIAQRIEAAKRLLKETDWPVMQVALEVGYQSQSHFTTLFKRKVGVPPGRYRRLTR
jgi:AraC family transcriptional regulator